MELKENCGQMPWRRFLYLYLNPLHGVERSILPGQPVLSLTSAKNPLHGVERYTLGNHIILSSSFNMESITWSWKLSIIVVSLSIFLLRNPLHGVERTAMPCSHLRDRGWGIHYMELKEVAHPPHPLHLPWESITWSWKIPDLSKSSDLDIPWIHYMELKGT